MSGSGELVAWLRREIERDLSAARIINAGGFSPQRWDTEPPGQVNPADIPQSRAVTDALGCDPEYICGWVQLVAYDKLNNEPDEAYGRDSGAPFALVDNGRREFEHIIRQDPRNVDARCEAALAILELCERVIREDVAKHAGCIAVDAWTGLAVAKLALAFLAAGYKHRPGYKKEWSA